MKRRHFLAVAEIALIAAAPWLAQAAARPADGAQAAAPSQPSQSQWDNPDLPIATAPPEPGARSATVFAEAGTPASALPPADARPPRAEPAIEDLLDTDVEPALASRQVAAPAALISAASSYAQAETRPAHGAPAPAPSQPSRSPWDNPDLPIATAPTERRARPAPAAPAFAEAGPPAAAPPAAAPPPLIVSAEARPPGAARSTEDLLDDVAAPSALTFAHAAAFAPNDAPAAAPEAGQPAQTGQAPTPDADGPIAAGSASGDAPTLSLAQVTVRLPGAPHAPPPTSPPPAPHGAPPTVTTTPLGHYGRPHINPYQRDIDMTVPLMYRDQSLGDLPVRITFDDQFFVDTNGFLQLIRSKLNPVAATALAKTLGEKQMFTGNDLAGSGVQLEYDPSSLSIVVLSIEADKRALERLFQQPHDDEGSADIKPARFSGYMNLSLNEAAYESGGVTTAPTLGMTGAIRFQSFVLEYEGSFGDLSSTGGDLSPTGSESEPQKYGFQRDFVRLVYDQPDDYRRWYLGDLTPEIRGDQGFVEMGGIGVLRSREPFNDFQSAVLQTNHQLLLQTDSDITILRNGVVYQQLHLRAGSYDLSALPLLTGSNDVQVEIRDNTGATQQLNFQSYLDPIDLQPGDYEYGAYFGPVSRVFGNSPNYDGPLAFTGFYRKAFVNMPSFGVGLQLASDVQDVTGQTQFLLPHAARLLLDAGFSHTESTGMGYAFGASYEQTFNRAGLVDSLVVRADYLSQHFAGLAAPDIDNTDALTVTGQYARAINRKLTLTADVTYTGEREGKGDEYRADLDLSYSFRPQWSVRAGVDYAHFNLPGQIGAGFGGTVSLVWQPNYRTRGEARYDSTINSAALSLTRAGDNKIGSVGYGAVLSRDSGQLDLAGFADYTGNRFDATIAQSSGSAGTLGGFGAQNVTSVTVDSSIAFADGAWGIGRRIPDSFALLYPHPSLNGRPVLAGQTIEGNDYIAESGPFGAAVNNALVDYTTQSIQYNVVNPPEGYDIGAGVVRVHPPYRAGYKIEVGTDAFVTATGTLIQPSGAPVSLIGGRVVAVGRPDLQPLPFFTNSVGRFGLIGLRPALHYRVEIYLNGQVVPAFEFTVPKDTKGLVQLKVVPMQKKS